MEKLALLHNSLVRGREPVECKTLTVTAVDATRGQVFAKVIPVELYTNSESQDVNIINLSLILKPLDNMWLRRTTGPSRNVTS